MVKYHELSKIADDSLHLNPSLSNSAWNMKIDLLEDQLKEIKKKKNDVALSTKIKSEIETLISKASDINKNHLTTIELRLSQLKFIQDVAGSKNIINDMLEIHKTSDFNIKSRINILIQDVLESFNNFDNIVDTKDIRRNFYEKHLSDKDIETIPELLLGKSEYFISVNNQIDKAKTYFVTALNSADIIHCMGRALLINNCLDNSHTDKLDKILENQKHAITDWHYYDLKSNLYLNRNEYSRAAEYEEKSYAAGMTFKHYACFG